MRALLVEDHPELQSHAERALHASGFAVDTVAAIEEADDAFAVASYDVVLLDRRLPDGDGLDWLKARRRARNATPVIIMSATMVGTNDLVEGLNAGADDYIVKPIQFDELVARVRAVLRRPSDMTRNVLCAGNLEFDTINREITIDGEMTCLARRETCLLECLIRRSGHVVAKASLEENLYGYGCEVTPNAIEVSLHRLRGSLKRIGANLKIHTVRGVGYMLHEERMAEQTRRAAPRRMNAAPSAAHV